jgi:hypothetical protein
VSVVLAVDGTLPPILAGRDPQDDSEEEVGDGMQGKRAVRQAPVKVDRGRKDRGLRHQHCDRYRK